MIYESKECFGWVLYRVIRDNYDYYFFSFGMRFEEKKYILMNE
jgi:hypothetical protein